MRVSIAIGALLVASCGKGGVEIVIEGETAQMTKVHLFVGVGDEYTEAIMPMTRQLPYPRSAAWARDDYNELDVRDVVSGEPVVFQFQGGDKLGVVIAIGADGDKPLAAAVAKGITVPSDYIARYELALEPINDGTNAAPLELDVWQPPAGGPKAGAVCVALFDKRTTSADAVVTDGDPDCDGWPTGDAKECQPNLFMSRKRPVLADTACLVPERVATPTGFNDGCLLGGPPCTDGHGLETGCIAPSVYCAPASLCQRCMMTADSFNCARDVSPFVSNYPSHLHCKLYVDVQGKLCTPLKALDMANGVGGHACRTGSEFPPRITTVGQPWAQQVTFGDGGTQITIKLDNLQSSCNFDILPSGTLGTTIERQVFAGLIAGMLDNGRGVAVPVVFEIDPVNLVGCDAQVACQPTWSWDPSELVDACVNTPVFPP